MPSPLRDEPSFSLRDRARSAAAQRMTNGSAPLLALGIAVVAWGLAPIVIRQVSASGLMVALYRLWVGVPIMWALAWFTGGHPSRAILKTTALAGALFATDVGLGFTAYQKTSVVNVALISSLAPLPIGLLAVRRFGDQISGRRAFWSLLALGGVLLVVLSRGGGGRQDGVGDLLAICSLATWTLYFLEIKRHRLAGLHPVALMAGVVTNGAIALTVPALLIADDPGAVGGTDWLWLVIMAAVPGAIGHSLVNWAQRYVDASVSSVLLLGNTVVATVLAWIVYDESLGPGQIVGALVVLGSLAALAISERS